MFNPGRLAECGSSGAEAEKLEGGKQSNAMRVTGHQPQPIIGKGRQGAPTATPGRLLPDLK